MARKPPPEGYANWKDYWNYKKDVATKYGTVPSSTVTVDIPGLKDIFLYERKSSYSKQLKYERYQRFKSKSSPVPSSLNWIPGVINQLDDAQDIMYTAMVLAKPILRRLPTRFIPVVGWALLIMDLLNLGTKVLSMAMTPGLTKPCIKTQVKKAKRGKKLLKDLFRDFLSPGGWRKTLAFALQAPQAMVNLTGYGLQLGTIMGAVSDSMWGGIRALQGKKVTFRSPPPSDPIGKAYRVLNQAASYGNQRDILTADEHALLMMAHQVALGIVLDSGLTYSNERCNILMDTEVAVYEPWELSTLEMLEEVGHPLDEDIIPYSNRELPTYDQIINDNVQDWYSWEQTIRDVMREFSEEYASVLYLIYRESADDMIEAVTGWSWDQYTEDAPIIKSAYEFAACDLMPWYPPSEAQVRQLLELAYTFAESRGADFPQCEDYRKAGTEIFGMMISKSKKTDLPASAATTIQ